MKIDTKMIWYPQWQDIPEIELYMDQLLTLLNGYLQAFYHDENVHVTNTMINNYVKKKVIEPPVKKRYQKNQIAKLFLICILKQIYCMEEIVELLTYFGEGETFSKTYVAFFEALKSYLCGAEHPEDDLLFYCAKSLAYTLLVRTNLAAKR